MKHQLQITFISVRAGTLTFKQLWDSMFGTRILLWDSVSRCSKTSIYSFIHSSEKPRLGALPVWKMILWRSTFVGGYVNLGLGGQALPSRLHHHPSWLHHERRELRCDDHRDHREQWVL